MALAPGTYPYTITATRADGVTNTASGTVVVGSPEAGVIAPIGAITNTQTLHAISTDVQDAPVFTQLGAIVNNQTLHNLSTDVDEVPMVTVNGATYLPSADGKIYGQYPLGDAPV